MDEPFAAVDALTREKLQDELLRLLSDTAAAGNAITIVLVTHDVAEAVYLSDEVVVFSPSPGTIRNRIPVDIRRPRARTDPGVLEIEERVWGMFRYDTNQEAEYQI
jgi:NitT/TauT family transport system ATP-binding protein